MIERLTKGVGLWKDCTISESFLTASGLILAVASLWTQFWYSHAQQSLNLPKDDDKKREFWEAGLGLAWSQIAALFALISFGWAVTATLGETGNVNTALMPIGLMIAALAMTAFAIVQSLLSVFYKSMFGPSLGGLLFGDRPVGRGPRASLRYWHFGMDMLRVCQGRKCARRVTTVLLVVG